MKHLKNNKGLSLVELIVSFAILAIAGVAVMGLIQAGTNHFNSTGKDVGLQYEQQVVVNRLRDALLEASDAISYDDSTKTLLIYTRKDMGITRSGAVAHEFQFDVAKIFLSGNELRYASKLVTSSGAHTSSGSFDHSILDGVSDTLLGEDVKDVEFFLDEIDKGIIKFDISFEADGKIITSNQVVSLRNAVKEVTDSGEILLASSETLVDNNILGVTIYRNGSALAANATVEIGLDGAETIKVPFTYKVSAVEKSREYSAVWSLHAVGSDMGVSGVDVNPSTGEVTVDPSQAPDGTSAVLVCTSVDNPNKKQTAILNIVNGGIYPTRLAVYSGTPTDYVGYRDYIVYPAISYTNNTVSTEGDLCTWKISVTPDSSGSTKLPTGSSFKLDPVSHRYTLRATSQLNNRTVTITATVKAPKKDGTRIAPVQITIPISDILEPDHPCDLLLTKEDDKELKRGEPTTVTASWNAQDPNADDTVTPASYPADYSLHWKIEGIGDDTWGRNNSERTDFEKTVKLVADTPTTSGTSALTSEGDGWYRASNGINTVKVDTETWLEWNREFQIKISCYATDNKGRRYGLGNDVEGTYTGPVEEVLKYKPVKILLTPQQYIPGEAQVASSRLLTQSQLKRAVKNAKLNGKWSTPDEIKINGRVVEGLKGRTLRMFEVSATGIKYDNTDRSAIKISKQAAQAANETTRNTTFTFYSATGYTVPKYEIPRGIQYFFAQYPEDATNGYVGFSVDMNTSLLKDYYKRFDDDASTISRSKRPRYVSVLFRAYDDKGNVSDTYIFNGTFNGSDEYNTDKMVNTRDFKYEIVFDYDDADEKNADGTYKLDDQGKHIPGPYFKRDYVEIRESGQ